MTVKHPLGPPMTLGNMREKGVRSWDEPDAADVGKGVDDPTATFITADSGDGKPDLTPNLLKDRL
jgi:hypothetical protein